MATIHGDILKGNTHTIILSLIEEQPMYGFQIATEVDRRSKGILHFKAGLLYLLFDSWKKKNWWKAIGVLPIKCRAADIIN